MFYKARLQSLQGGQPGGPWLPAGCGRACNHAPRMRHAAKSSYVQTKPFCGHDNSGHAWRDQGGTTLQLPRLDRHRPYVWMVVVVVAGALPGFALLHVGPLPLTVPAAVLAAYLTALVAVRVRGWWASSGVVPAVSVVATAAAAEWPWLAGLQGILLAASLALPRPARHCVLAKRQIGQRTAQARDTLRPASRTATLARHGL